uniref:Uncharacterized protein n=1 Tax=Magnetococcus massalia (strain MO-1) TaxID=451514 RepID=A0A1S7LDF0_MAGMO|nr:protein of unknown function [Candidatus Magnetococcus massalia]
MDSAKATSHHLASMETHLHTSQKPDETGMTEERAWRSATNQRGAWWNAGASHMNAAFPKKFFDRLGLLSLLRQRQRLQSLT